MGANTSAKGGAGAADGKWTFADATGKLQGPEIPENAGPIYQLPTRNVVNKNKKAALKKLMDWFNKPSTTKGFNENFDPQWPENKDEFVWRPGMKAYSQILNGPHNGKWIEVFVTAVHPNGKLDLKIPD